MRLDENFQICLLALACRCPKHTIDLDREVGEILGCETEDWTAFEIIDLLKTTAPLWLQMPARLIIDECHCVIYLSGFAEEKPALHIHCRGKVPTHKKQDTKGTIKNQLVVSQ